MTVNCLLAGLCLSLAFSFPTHAAPGRFTSVALSAAWMLASTPWSIPARTLAS